MVDVRRDDGATARHFVTHKLGANLVGNVRTKRLAGMAATQELVLVLLQPHVLPDGYEFHFRRDHPFARVMHLRHVHTRLGTPRLTQVGKPHADKLRIREPLAPVCRTDIGQLLAIVTFLDPACAQCR